MFCFCYRNGLAVHIWLFFRGEEQPVGAAGEECLCADVVAVAPFPGGDGFWNRYFVSWSGEGPFAGGELWDCRFLVGAEEAAQLWCGGGIDAEDPEGGTEG